MLKQCGFWYSVATWRIAFPFEHKPAGKYPYGLPSLPVKAPCIHAMTEPDFFLRPHDCEQLHREIRGYPTFFYFSGMFFEGR